MANSHRPPIQDFEELHLKGAQYFSIDKVSDPTTTLPHMLPSAAQFAEQVSQMGISNNNHVICYDSTGQYFASARVWWMFRVFGHEQVSVLSRGLIKDEWQNSPQLIAAGPDTPPKKGNFKAREPSSDLYKSMRDILSNISEGKFQVVDARSYDRFYGRVLESRPKLQSGHIPNSKSVPFNLVLENKEILYKENLRDIVTKAGIDLSKPIVTSCGSGVSAAVVSLALLSALGKDSAIYDGSWSEYAQESLANPVAKD